MKAVIIEDEKLVAKELLAKLINIDPSIEIVALLPSLKTSLNWFAENAEPDLIFADIQLSDGVSFDLFEKFSLSCPIIFTTAYNEYAIKAFKVNGIDYLLKPIEIDELERALIKAKEIIKSRFKANIDVSKLVETLQSFYSKNNYKEHFLAHFRNNLIPIKVSEIALFNYESINYCINMFGEKYMLDIETLDEIEQLLDPAIFYRANRNFIINLHSINSIANQMNGKLLLKLKAPNTNFEIDISRDKAPKFRKWLEK